ncbi:hypothetical protein M2480_002377 [Parabacteroides sp. PFB2-12]|uniref:NVEALA domain-containing protein n=1 Tax=unclassified Parabacteroides TaxID=2649774 RepID=UPI0024757CB8|nr:MULTISPECIES: NVEALA domain-containing protein [unclassified Parabacteroides]MDH6343637.1 hypothetical protein [Parabacteroides sp. PM6-13]MDH6391382.1 hypothetical protein [Parabacteroides sp. PFB2-12]
MKKKKVSLVMVAAIAVAAGWGIYLNEKEVNLSDLVLANVEALATPEWIDDWARGYITGEDIREGVRMPCCVPSVYTDACDYKRLGCIKY